MKLNYIFPGLNLNGGLEGFARDVSKEINKKVRINLFDYKNSLGYFSKLLMRISPKKLSAKMYLRTYSKLLRKQYPKFKEDSVFHFWHIEPALLFLDKCYIITCHGNEILMKNVTSFRRELYKKALFGARLIHANSNYTKKYLINNFSIDPNKILVIHPLINFKKLSSIRVKNNKKIVIGTISRFVKRKNILNVINALNILKEKYKIDFTYHLAGDGPEKKNILKKLKYAKFKWKYFGKISDKEKFHKFYPFLDVFVMPPLQLNDSVEGFGIVYIEANAYGIPVVASKTGGVEDAVKENVSGVFANPTNSNDIAKKIYYILRDKYKFKPRKWANNFDKSKIIKKFERMYLKAEKMP